MSEARVLVLGVTSAIGRALAGRFAAEGRDLVVAGRDPEEVELVAADLRVRHRVEVAALAFEAAAMDSHPAFLARCLEVSGGVLEGAALCFGFMGEQADAQRDPAVLRSTFDVCLTGAASILELLAAHLEVRRKGFLCVLSSVAGDRGRQSNYIYGAAKGGLTIYLQGLRNRLHPAGVTVTTVKPGFVDTRMTWGRKGLFLVASPEAAARAIHRAVRRGAGEVYVPWFWEIIMGIIRAIPEAVFKRLRL